MFSRCFLLLLVVLVVPRLSAEPVELAVGGDARLPIVVGATADEGVREHAATLAEQLRRMTGAVFEVTEGDGTRGLVVGLVTDFALPGMGEALAVDGLGERESYLLRSHGGGLYVLANTQIGLQHGVWDVLHRLGYRQYFPGEVWEHVPELERAVLDVDSVETPDYVVRRIWYGYGTWGMNQESDREWQVRNRGVSDFRLNTGHAYDNIIRRNQALFEEYPHYYGLLNGERNSSKICIGNAEVVQMVVEYARRFFESNPEADSVSVDPSDGGGWCECRACAEIGSPSNRALTLANAVSALLEAEYPGKYVGMYAYSEHAPPPTIQARPRVVISAATAFLKGASVQEYIAGWQRQGVQQFGIREYYSVNTWDRDLPGAPRGSRLKYLTTTLVDFHERGARFMSSESSDNWGVNGLGYYVASRLMWDTDLAEQVPAMVDEFLTNCFGPAAEPMRGFYEIVGGEADTKLSKDLLGRMYGALAEARELAGDRPAVLARLDHLLLYTRYVELYRLYANARGNERQANFEQLIRHAYRMRGTHMVHSLALYRDLNNRDGSVIIPDDAQWQEPEGERPAEPEDALDGMLSELEEDLIDRPPPKFNPWKSSEPWSSEELATMLREGLAANPTVDFERVSFSEELVPATPLQLPAREPLEDSTSDRGLRTYYLWQETAPLRLRVQVTGGLISHYRDRGPAELGLHHGESREPVARGESAPDGETREITLSSPYAGLHWLTASDGMDRTRVVFPEGVGRTISLRDPRATNHSGRRNLYIYVPKGTRVLGGFSSCSTGAIRDAEDEVAIAFSGDRDYFSVPVPEGHDGRLWRLDGTAGGLELLTIPPYAADRVDALLLPREVVEADAP